jgi:hypothetical protein
MNINPMQSAHAAPRALPRGLRQPNKNKHLAESGTPKPSTGSFGFLPRVSHQDTTRESKSPDCASTLTLIISPALRGVGRYQAYLDGDDLVLCVSRMPFLDAARALIAAGHDADAILEMSQPGASSWTARTVLSRYSIGCSRNAFRAEVYPPSTAHRRVRGLQWIDHPCVFRE